MSPPSRNFNLRLRLRAARSPNTEVPNTSDQNGNQRLQMQRTDSSNTDEPGTSSQQCGKKNSWRVKLKKKSPKAYAAYLKHDAAAARLRRLETKEVLDKPENAELKKAKQAKKAAYMRAFREKKKLERMKAERADEERRKRGEKVKKKVKTRAEAEKERAFKDKDAARQRLRRAAMTLKQKKAINKKRCDKRQAEKEQLETLLFQQRELEDRRMKHKKQLEEEAKRLMEEWTKLEKEKKIHKASPAKRKRLSRARASISKNPILFAETVSDLVSKASPRKKGLLDKTFKTKDWKSHVGDALANKMSALHKSRKKKDLVLKRAIGSTLQVCKKYRVQRKMCKAFRISSRSFKGRQTISRHGRKISPAVKKAVHDTYEEMSITLPDKKFVSKKTGKPAGFLLHPITEVYSKFKTKYPETKMGLSKFTALRPPHIRKRNAIKYRGCLCEYCANVELKMSTINQQARRDNMATPFVSIYDVNNSTLCRKVGNFHKLQCVERDCEECGVHKVSSMLELLKEKERGNIAWKKWERDNETKKMVLQLKYNSLDFIIKDLENDLVTFSNHLFTSSWQSRQYSNLSRNPPHGWLVMVFDFAENYACRYQDEIQSVHWGHAAATLHPIVCNYKCPRCDDVVTHSLIMISDDINHDYHAVYQFTALAIRHVKSVIHVEKIVRFSDGAPNQYKSRGPFLDVSFAAQDYGIPFQHEFFGSRHGKGPSDGESGVIKRLATDAVMAGTAVIRSAQEMYAFVRDRAVRPSVEVPDTCYHFRRDAFWVDAASISRDRGRRAIKAVDGTRQFHSVVSVKPGVVATRSLSCFCAGCIMEEDEGCQNASHVKPYKKRSIPYESEVLSIPCETEALSSTFTHQRASRKSSKASVSPDKTAPSSLARPNQKFSVATVTPDQTSAPSTSRLVSTCRSFKTSGTPDQASPPSSVRPNQKSSKASVTPDQASPAASSRPVSSFKSSRASVSPDQVFLPSVGPDQKSSKASVTPDQASLAASSRPVSSFKSSRASVSPDQAFPPPSVSPDQKSSTASVTADQASPPSSVSPDQKSSKTSVTPEQVSPASSSRSVATFRYSKASVTPDQVLSPSSDGPAQKLANNMYVAVRFRCRPRNVLYLAMIINVEGDDITLAFMEGDNSGNFGFTKENHHVHPVEDICCVLSDPVLLHLQRSLKYKFNQSELDELVKREAAVLK